MRIQIPGVFFPSVQQNVARVVCPRDAMPGAKERFGGPNLTPVETRATTPRGSAMSHNTFGHLFRVTTFGESHGVALGCVVDGCPPGLPLEAEESQAELDRRNASQAR